MEAAVRATAPGEGAPASGPPDPTDPTGAPDAPDPGECDVLMADGRPVRLRAIRPDDRTALAAAFTQLSPESVYLRFFRAKQRLTDDELTRFTQLDFVHRAALLATLRLDGRERIIGVARYARTHPGRAEVAFTVGDAYQGRGVGSLLLEHLVLVARDNGISWTVARSRTLAAA